MAFENIVTVLVAPGDRSRAEELGLVFNADRTTSFHIDVAEAGIATLADIRDGLVEIPTFQDRVNMVAADKARRRLIDAERQVEAAKSRKEAAERASGHPGAEFGPLSQAEQEAVDLITSPEHERRVLRREVCEGLATTCDDLSKVCRIIAERTGGDNNGIDACTVAQSVADLAATVEQVVSAVRLLAVSDVDR